MKDLQLNQWITALQNMTFLMISTENFQMYKVDLEKAKEPETKLPTSVGLRRKHVQFSSVIQSCPTLCNPMNRSMPGVPVHHQLPEFTQTHVHWVGDDMMTSNHLILCRSLLLLPSIFPSIRVFSKKSALHIRWPKYWSFSFNISPSNEDPELISFRMDWLDLLAVQGTL